MFKLTAIFEQSRTSFRAEQNFMIIFNDAASKEALAAVD